MEDYFSFQNGGYWGFFAGEKPKDNFITFQNQAWGEPLWMDAYGKLMEVVNWQFLANMVRQITWTCQKFNRLLRGSNDDVFFQTKYERDQYDEPSTRTCQESTQPHYDDAHDTTWRIYQRDDMKQKMVK